MHYVTAKEMETLDRLAVEHGLEIQQISSTFAEVLQFDRPLELPEFHALPDGLLEIE